MNIHAAALGVEASGVQWLRRGRSRDLTIISWQFRVHTFERASCVIAVAAKPVDGRDQVRRHLAVGGTANVHEAERLNAHAPARVVLTRQCRASGAVGDRFRADGAVRHDGRRKEHCGMAKWLSSITYGSGALSTAVLVIRHGHLHNVEDGRRVPEFASTLTVRAKASEPTTRLRVLDQVPRALVGEL